MKTEICKIEHDGKTYSGYLDSILYSTVKIFFTDAEGTKHYRVITSKELEEYLDKDIDSEWV